MSNKPAYIYSKSSYVDVTTNAKGQKSDRLTIYMTPEQAVNLAEELRIFANEAAANDTSVRFVSYTGVRINSQTNEQFLSTAFTVGVRQRQTGPLNAGMEARQSSFRGKSGRSQSGPRRQSDQGVEPTAPRNDPPAAQSPGVKSPNEAEDIPF